MYPIPLIIAADHRGFALKEFLRAHEQVGDHAVAWYDVGTVTSERTDYPIYAHMAVQRWQQCDGEARMVMLCGTGAGMAITANRYPRVYAGVAWNPDVARKLREDDDVNCLVLPADYLDEQTAQACLESWLSAKFKGGRYAERLAAVELG